MAKVTNKTSRGVALRGWRVLPNSSKVVDRMGHIHETMPDADAYCPQAKRLADQGVLVLAGYTPKTALTKAAKVVPEKAPGPDANKAVEVKDGVKAEDKVEVKPKRRRKGSSGE